MVNLFQAITKDQELQNDTRLKCDSPVRRALGVYLEESE